MGRRSVVDSSAVLALLGNEPGSDKVETALSEGALMSSVNLSEVTGKLVEVGMSVEAVRRTMSELGFEIVAFDADLAFQAGAMRIQTRSQGLSLGDRACICLGISLGLPVVTADRRWLECNLPVEVQLIR